VPPLASNLRTVSTQLSIEKGLFKLQPHSLVRHPNYLRTYATGKCVVYGDRHDLVKFQYSLRYHKGALQAEIFHLTRNALTL